MGRIHRYGQEHDCLIFNFVAVNTREGRVLAKLLERLLEIRSELGTDQVFDVVGEVFPANLLEKLFREMYVRRTDLSNIEARIVRDVDPERFRKITSSTLEGLLRFLESIWVWGKCPVFESFSVYRESSNRVFDLER
jgi:SNF2 family DNA or RNA helicase